MQGVSVWDHRPHPSELLERRLAAGWMPTSSPLRHGDVVDGYAACLVERQSGS